MRLARSVLLGSILSLGILLLILPMEVRGYRFFLDTDGDLTTEDSVVVTLNRINVRLVVAFDEDDLQTPPETVGGWMSWDCTDHTGPLGGFTPHGSVDRGDWRFFPPELGPAFTDYEEFYCLMLGCECESSFGFYATVVPENMTGIDVLIDLELQRGHFGNVEFRISGGDTELTFTMMGDGEPPVMTISSTWGRIKSIYRESN